MSTVAQTGNQAQGHAAALARLQAIEAEMTAALIEREEAVRITLLAILARQHAVLLGPPGTAKSMTIELLSERVASANGGLRRFVWLMSKYTTPEELFGPVSVAGLKQDQYRRITANKLPEAEVGFLDEVFKSNPSILNALLTILNERAFDNGPARIDVPLMSLFGGSNELPQGDDSGALWDRFLLRGIVGYVREAGFAKLLRLTIAAKATPTTIPVADLVALQAAAAATPIGDDVLTIIEQLRRDLAADGIVASDRRWMQTLGVLRANALLDGRAAVEEDDLATLAHMLWTQPDQRPKIARAVGRIANPLNQKAIELLDAAVSVYDAAQAAQRDGALSNEQKMNNAVEAMGKLKQIGREIRQVKAAAETQGRSTGRIDRALERAREMHGEITKHVTEI